MILDNGCFEIGAGFGKKRKRRRRRVLLVSANGFCLQQAWALSMVRTQSVFQIPTISMKLVGSANVLVSVDSRNEKRTSVVQLSYIKSTSIILPAGNSSRTTSLTYLSSWAECMINSLKTISKVFIGLVFDPLDSYYYSSIAIEFVHSVEGHHIPQARP